jgi:NADPH:quinone reductase-like Zn-dependent oxidoreductase
VTYGEGLAQRVRDAAPEGVSAAVDYVGTDEAFAVSGELVADASRIASNVDPQAVGEVGGRYAFVRPQSEDLRELSELVDEGRLRIEVQATYALSDAARAHEESQAGHVRGKLVLEID